MSRNFEQALQSLLRGEIAAAETYAQVLADNGVPGSPVLRQMQVEHGRAIRFWSDQLAARGCDVPQSSGAWGVFAQAVEGGARLFGNRLALAALREGERRGLHDYESAAANRELPTECRVFIERELVPTQRRHVEQLERLLQQV